MGNYRTDTFKACWFLSLTTTFLRNGLLRSPWLSGQTHGCCGWWESIAGCKTGFFMNYLTYSSLAI